MRTIEDNNEMISRIIVELARTRRSRAWLAEELGCSRQSMNWFFNHGINKLKPVFINRLKKICESLGCNYNWLVYGKGSKDEVCEWFNEIEYDRYITDCMNVFHLSNDSLISARFKFCPFCGKPISENRGV